MSIVAVDGIFRALANPTRRTILRLARDEARPVGELASELALSQPAVSQHLAVLREAGLVSVRQAGRQRLYRADMATLAEAGQFFEEYWSSATDRLASRAEQAAADRVAAS